MLRMPATKIAYGIIFVAILATNIKADNNCVPRNFGYSSIVCVCNSTYCDSAAVDYPARGQYRVYESGQSGNRMVQHTGSIANRSRNANNENRITLTLNPDRAYQTIFGFGGAFTDAAGMNIRWLSPAAQNRVIETYFSEQGSRYTLGRVPIAGTDFSTRPYSYDDSTFPDVALYHFALANEDHEFKIPLIQKALQYNPNLRLISAAWSAPGWMKTNHELTAPGFLDPQYYQTYAEYLVRFLTEYQKNGVKIWAITTGNEPNDVLEPNVVKFNNMGWTPSTMATWVGVNLGPTIAQSASNDTIIVMLDDQRYSLPWYAVDVLVDPRANLYTAGIATHWYMDDVVPASVLDQTHDLFPNKFLLMTEACTGSEPWEEPKVRLGDWRRGERYIEDIINSMNHWMTGWLDWNLALNADGGPNWVQNFVDSPIIVDPDTDEFYKQPMYYALAHFSKFVGPGSKRIDITSSFNVLTTAFLTPEDNIVIVLYNKNTNDTAVTIADRKQGDISINVPALTVQTIIYHG